MSALIRRGLLCTTAGRTVCMQGASAVIDVQQAALGYSNMRLFFTLAKSKNNPTLSLLGLTLPAVTFPFSCNQTRWYAKKAKKDKGKKDAKPKVTLSDEELNSVVNFDKMSEQMALTVDHLRQEYVEKVTLRTTVGAFDNLIVDTEEGRFPLIQLGQLAQKSPQLIVINLATSPQYIPSVKTAIMNSGMNLSPQQDGTTLFVPIPKVTREHRENLAKNTKTLCERTKEKLKDVQNRYIRDLKKVKSEHSEDLIRNLQDMIHLKMHSYAEEATSIMTAKQNELLGNK